MKTPAQWLAQIKQASDTEPRHGSSVILLESDIKAIYMDGWEEGMNEAINISLDDNYNSAKLIEDRINEVKRLLRLPKTL